jgi:hypothetical protein
MGYWKTDDNSILSAKRGNHGLEERYDYLMLLNCADRRFQEFNALNLHLLRQTGFLTSCKRM